jgi:nicotinamide mononucleotide adenylyltransferase
MKGNQWARLLAYVTGQVNQELLLQNEYLAAENRILRAHLPARLRLSDPERRTLAEIGKRVRVQERLAWSAGGRPAGVRVRTPVAWIAGRKEIET